MFREMRRFKQALSAEECIAVLERGTSGVLAVLGDDGYPYAVPLSYAYHDSKLYFHCAKIGHKLDAIERDDKASFCVVDKDDVVPEDLTSLFRSVVAFGRVRVLTDDDEKMRALELLAERYWPDHQQEGRAEIARQFERLHALEFAVEHMTGKQATELIAK